MRHKYLLFLSVSLATLWFAGCSNEDLEPTGITIKEETEEETETDTTYTIPSYVDDYAAMASWNDRSDWNLANVHDPSVVYDGEYYYMYGTNASYGNAHDGHGHFHGRRSKDLVDWSYIGASMSETPAWVKDTLNNMRARVDLDPIVNPVFGHWAPVVRKVGNVYRMYYSIVVDNLIGNGLPFSQDNFDNTWTERAFIGMMETSDLSQNSWEDKGMVVCSVSDRGTDWQRSSTNDWSGYFKYNAIDPSYVITPEGEHWLFYGSWHSGIAAVQMDSGTGLPLHTFDSTDESTWGTHIYTRTQGSRWQGSEGPEVIYNAETGYYYLFLAYDGLDVPYNTRVCRAENVTGPYKGYNGSSVTNGGDVYPILTHPYKFDNHSGWVGFAHNAMFMNEESGDWLYASQARLPANTGGNAYSNAIMMGHVRLVRWTEDGWPVVMPERYTAVPEQAIGEDELAGDWEQITLRYEYGTQQTSLALSLSADGKATGAMTGDWSFDETQQILTIGSTQLCVEREVDWEASPRVLTLVFAGLNSYGESIWGKKVQ
ncbi:arabinan endo-1,5-alpha-L-arabinosidase [Reichenbachiella sp. 5M10]|uniref:arabinan endo-1,5-alpha-L-arabinosidase n=1 Tax=Reichenbachiella sp. 5M10 TaxID=1889772 RepID=UPI000C14D720|nr:arabinan endo-1,5-alpha-L-arabinosidase [Reichenbachiella sp. 5M10]PIB34692.1 arabinan endo-1,5-alpha-L-arabinosidase [Reichenbachiella sp. 5M10]